MALADSLALFRNSCTLLIPSKVWQVGCKQETQGCVRAPDRCSLQHMAERSCGSFFAFCRFFFLSFFAGCQKYSLNKSTRKSPQRNIMDFLLFPFCQLVSVRANKSSELPLPQRRSQKFHSQKYGACWRRAWRGSRTYYMAKNFSDNNNPLRYGCGAFRGKIISYFHL